MIYLDHHATTPCLDKVIEVMNQFHKIDFANLGSTHAFGKDVKKKFKSIENELLNNLGCVPLNFIYTSGATESINLAHLGLLDYCLEHNVQVISSKIEHQATLNVLDHMKKKGVRVALLNVDRFGHIDLNQLKQCLQTHKTALLSFILANNEVGTIQDYQACIQLAKEYGAWVHMDISQSLCTQSSFAAFSETDLLSFSGHKIYGPKGIGGLIINKTSSKRIPLKPILYGGHSSSQALRPGTHSTALAAGLCVAMLECFEHAEHRNKHFINLKGQFLKNLERSLDVWFLDGDPQGLSHNVHLSFADIPYSPVAYLKAIAVSSGSTCRADAKEPSHVLKAMGLSDQQALSSLRIGLGLSNTEDDMDQAVEDITQTVDRIRKKTRL